MCNYRKLFAVFPKAREEVKVAGKRCLESGYEVIEGTENRLVEGGIAEERDEDDDQKDAISEKGECTQAAPLPLRSHHSTGLTEPTVFPPPGADRGRQNGIVAMIQTRLPVIPSAARNLKSIAARPHSRYHVYVMTNNVSRDFPYWQSSDSKGSPNEMVAS